MPNYEIIFVFSTKKYNVESIGFSCLQIGHIIKINIIENSRKKQKM